MLSMNKLEVKMYHSECITGQVLISDLLILCKYKLMQDEIDLEAKQNNPEICFMCFYKCKFFSGNLSWLRECLDNRVGVNGLDKAGSTALYWACHGGHKGITFCLLSQMSVLLKMCFI